MKNFILFFSCCFIALCSKAQTNWFVKGGATQSTATVFFKNATQTVKAKNGFTGAIGARVQFEGNLHFVSSIGLSKKGFSFSPAANQNIDYAITYIDVTSGLQYNFKLGGNSFLVVGFMPQANFTKFGNLKNTLNGVTTKEKMSFGFGSYGAIDFGIQGSLGLQFKKFFIEAAYTSSSANINQDEETRVGDIYKNRMISIQLGYYLR